jgi:hypothetical protein
MTVSRLSLAPRLVTHGVSLLETEFGNRKMHHIVIVYLQCPLRQDVERCHDPCYMGSEIGPHTMVHLLAVADGGQHRQHRFHHHPRVPGPARADFHVGGVPGRGMESGVGEDDHDVVKLGNQG